VRMACPRAPGDAQFPCNAANFMTSAIVSVTGMSKSFPGVRSLDRVDLEVARGEVRALVGENGAGKSTLIKIIAGAYRPDDGELAFDGRSTRWSSPHEAARAGVHVIYQELILFPDMTVAQNIFVNDQPRNRFGLIDKADMRRRATAILEELGSPIDPDEKVRNLTVASQQLVEIARALKSNAKLIIFDEPTAVLGGHEVDILFAMIARLKARGVAVIFISHRLEEVFAIADSATVLKDGKLVGTLPVKELTQGKLVSMMIGRPLADMFPPKATSEPQGAPVLAANDIWSGPKVKGISLALHKGEIVGLAGMVGSGRTEIAHALFGSAPLERGSVTQGDTAATSPDPCQSIARGIGFLTENRKEEGLFMLQDIAVNISAPILGRIGSALFLNRTAERTLARQQIAQYAIAATGPNAAVVNLSGGNQQKVLLGRWVNTSNTALILDEPTRGVDVGAKMEIYRIIRELANRGLGILVISSELPEIIGLCDRVIVIAEGRKTGELTGRDLTEERVMELAVATGGAGLPNGVAA
jgi:ribose transport system ATP-binding protein